MVIKSYRDRIIIFAIVIFIFALFLTGRLFYIQLVNSNKMRGMGKGEHTKKIQIESARGTIFDRNLKELAISIEVDTIVAQPKQIKKPSLTAIKLANILKIDSKTIYAKLRDNSSFAWIKRKVSKKQALQVRALNLEGIGFLKEYKRFYPKGHLAAHLIGFAGLDNNGLEGIELTYDKYLTGEIIDLEIIRDGNGQNIIISPEIKKASNGNDIILTIDEVIQHHAELELEKVCRKHQAKSGSIIVMNPKTGEILALAIQPVYDPNYFNQYPPDQFRNRVLTDMFEPGSTFKIISAAALLKENLIDLNKMYFCPGYIQVGNRIVRCHHPHGSLNLEGIITNSCNVGIIQCVRNLDNRKFYSLISDFGLNELTKIDLYGEKNGLLAHPRYWSVLTKSNIAMGQGISITPLQLITAVGAIANNGILMKPLIVKAIRNPEGKIIKKFKPTPVRQVISPEVAKEITQLLKKVVTEGTGKLAEINGYEIAGKTGTAQKVDLEEGGYSSTKSIASFIGYLPADDPNLIILVIVDEPKGISWGGYVSAPTFKEVVKRILSYQKIVPTKKI